MLYSAHTPSYDRNLFTSALTRYHFRAPATPPTLFVHVIQCCLGNQAGSLSMEIALLFISLRIWLPTGRN